MLEGMYSAAAGMQAQQARLDALSNDIANVNTAGYKQLRVGFRDLLYSKAGLATTDAVQLGAGAAMTTIGRTSTQGAIQQTGETLDVAISGPGYLQVKSAAGERLLTRDGHLQVDIRGRVSTSSGQLLDPPVTLPAGADPTTLAIGPTGQVTAGGKTIGQITLVDVSAPTQLRAAGDNAYGLTAGSGAPRAVGAGSTLINGAVEMSNADLGDSMTAMIEAQRAFELTSKAITTQDKVAEIALGVKR